MATYSQLNNLFSILLNNVNPDGIDARVLQEDLIKKPVEAAALFIQWVNSGGQMIVNQPRTLQLPSTFNPAEFFENKNWTVWKGPPNGKGLEGEEENCEPTDLELSAERMLFEHFLNDGEDTIIGETKLTRAKESKKILLGGRSFLALWQDYQATKDNSVLELLRKNKGIKWMDFPGLVLRSPRGNRCMLCLYFGGGTWYWRYNWLDDDWSRRDPSAVLEQVSS